uniref:Uncharacterized protein n=1 Tax=viral metagenome TaxID=1070528 RepID=A0A6C0JBK0_9ZZZZ
MSVVLPHISKINRSLEGVYMFYDSKHNINVVKNCNRRILKYNINTIHDFYILEEDKKSISLMPILLSKNTQDIVDTLLKILPLVENKSIYVLFSKEDFIGKLKEKIKNKKIKECIKDKKKYTIIY